jgi:homoserine acetyltransferase
MTDRQSKLTAAAELFLRDHGDYGYSETSLYVALVDAGFDVAGRSNASYRRLLGDFRRAIQNIRRDQIVASLKADGIIPVDTRAEVRKALGRLEAGYNVFEATSDSVEG